MQRVLVVDSNRNPLMPCHPARARQLLKSRKAAVLRRYPMTIILKDRSEGEVQPVKLKIDPGSKTTGLALVAEGKRSQKVVWAGELTHRGEQIKNGLLKRRMLRRGRRSRKTRYRKPRFSNRRRLAGWLAPSLESRVLNVETWVKRLCKFSPVNSITIELAKFDTQAMENPEIKGIEYQQGTMHGYDVREYLLEKWGRKCAYCGIENVPLQVEHIVPRTRGGSNRVSNLTLACKPCNQDKGNQTAKEYGFPNIQAVAQRTLKDAAVINSTRWEMYRRVRDFGLEVEVGTGSRTKFNRRKQGYPKAHWIDAVCVGKSGECVYIHQNHAPLFIKATGRQSRLMCWPDRFGFPRTRAKQGRIRFGFQTGDVVQADVPRGKMKGVHKGKVAVRSSGSFRVTTADGVVQGISYKYCKKIFRADGYRYQNGKEDGATHHG